MSSRASFILSSPTPEGLPDLGLPEIAVVGRSNVGKSSLLASLLETRNLVRTSRTPGRTQLINLFTLANKLALVDLPGYGYAKLSKQILAQMNKMIHSYIAERDGLKGVLLLLDARREEASAADKAMGKFALDNGRPVLLVMTKADQITKPTRLARQRKLEHSFGVPAGYSIMTSSKTGLGQDELRERILDLFQ